MSPALYICLIRTTFTVPENRYLKNILYIYCIFIKFRIYRKKGNNIGRLLVVEFKENETHPFDEIMKVFRKYPDFQKYEIYYAPAISLHDLEILPDRRKVYCGKQEVSLTTKEFNLLCYFVANAGRVLTYEQIYQKSCGSDHAADCRCRKTGGDCGGEGCKSCYSRS